MLTGHVEVMYAEFVAAGGNPGRGVGWIRNLAHVAAQEYYDLGYSHVDYQPGNGTRYAMVLHNLVQHEPRVQPLAPSVGGELLVALPDNAGGVSFVLGLPAGYIAPGWLSVHTGDRIRLADAVPLAAFLTFFADRLTEVRADRPNAGPPTTMGR